MPGRPMPGTTFFFPKSIFATFTLHHRIALGLTTSSELMYCNLGLWRGHSRLGFVRVWRPQQQPVGLALGPSQSHPAQFF